jgi:hypothetical protein
MIPTSTAGKTVGNKIVSSFIRIYKAIIEMIQALSNTIILNKIISIIMNIIKIFKH